MDKQTVALEKINNGDNLCITGPGGVGKSYLLNKVKTDRTIVVAPTGIAALNVGGVTVNSMFGIPSSYPTEKDWNTIPSKLFRAFTKMGGADRLVIDEIGMVRSNNLDIISYKLQQALGNNIPFGGIQTVVFGDFYQLPPIVSKEESRLFYKDYKSPYAFDSGSWDFNMVELDKVYRNDDERQVRLLNTIRTGGDPWAGSKPISGKQKLEYLKLAVKRVNEITMPYENCEGMLHLCQLNRSADVINQQNYSEIVSEEKSYVGEITGDDGWKDSHVDHVIRLKAGCKVIICANDIGGSYRNGERGIVTSLHPNGITVKKDNGEIVLITDHTWEKFEYTDVGGKLEKTVRSSFKQLPIRLGYAISIHKSQGMTLDGFALDLGDNVWTPGLSYVGLSRARNLEQVSLVRPFRRSDIKVSKEVSSFYGQNRTTS